MNTYQEYETIIIQGKVLETKLLKLEEYPVPTRNGIEIEYRATLTGDQKTALEKWIVVSRTVLGILAKYFFKNDKITIPPLYMIWEYVNLVRELYDYFKSIKK